MMVATTGLGIKRSLLKFQNPPSYSFTKGDYRHFSSARLAIQSEKGRNP